MSLRRIAFVGLMKIEIPGHTVRLCDGGFMVFEGETYRSKDPVYGSIGSLEPLNEGVGAEVPVFELGLLPPGTTDPADLVPPGFQTSRARFWLGEYDVDAGTLDGEPDLLFDGVADQCTLEFGRDSLSMQTSIVASTARLLERNAGNGLSSTFHKSVWPGETGEDGATGLSLPDPWGVEAPPAMGGGYTTAVNGWTVNEYVNV